MKLAWNFEAKDLMKRVSQPMQGLVPHSGMLTTTVRLRSCTESGLFPTYIFIFLNI